MTRRNDEHLLQQLASDVARLTDENAALRSALAEATQARLYWLSVAADRQQRLLASARRRPRAAQPVPCAPAAPVAARLQPGPTLGLPGDDATVGQEAAA